MASVNQKLVARELEEFRSGFPGYEDSAAFELFTAWAVMRRYDLDTYSALESGRVGKGRDGGIDWIYFISNGRVIEDFDDENPDLFPSNSKFEVLIGQAKNTASFKASVGTNFFSTFSDLFNLDPDDSPVRAYSPELEEKISSFFDYYYNVAKKRPELEFKIYSCSVADKPPHEDVRAAMDLAAKVLEKVFSNAEVYVSFLGAEELFNRITELPSYDSSLRYQEEADSELGKVALVRLKDYYQFLLGDSGEINSHYFEDNVRDFAGAVKVNKEIKWSLENPQECSEFWWLNNGITMLTSEPPVSTRKVYTLSDVQIVNGLQTSYSIFDFFRENEDRLETDGRSVLIRIIAPSDDSEKDQIIRATNSQNAVPPASLRATDPVHRKIESALQLHGLYYERRKNYYKNKKYSLKSIISITLLSQAVISAFLMRPDTARARPSSFLAKEETYLEIFQDREMNDFIWAARVQKAVEEILSKLEDWTPGERNNYRFYVLMMARLLGSYARTNALRWDVSACLNDWSPSSKQIIELAEWTRYVGNMASARTSSNLDRLCKGPDLLRALEEEWLAGGQFVQRVSKDL